MAPPGPHVFAHGPPTQERDVPENPMPENPMPENLMNDDSRAPLGVSSAGRTLGLGELTRQVRLVAEVFDAAPIGVAVWSIGGDLLHANPVQCDLLGHPWDELVGQPFERFVPPNQGPVVRRLVEDLWRGERNSFSCELRCRLPDGTEVLLQADLTAVYGSGGRPAYLVSQIFDFSPVGAGAPYVESAPGGSDTRADTLARVLDAGSDYLMIAERNGAISYVNNAASEVLGVRPADPDDGEPPFFLWDVLDSESFEFFHEQVEPILIDTGIWRGELVVRSSSGSPIPVSALFLAHHDAYGRLESISAVARDISDLKAAQGQLHELATHDYLTGMPNRVLLYDRLEQSLARFHRYGQPVALLYLDLDRFKPVNDAYGHHVGDQVLRVVAERINAVVRDTDTAARIGGDEFCVLVEGVADQALLIGVAERLIDVVSQPIDLHEHRASVGVSIGMVSVDERCDEADTLIALADAAMYRAKATGRGRLVVHQMEGSA